MITAGKEGIYVSVMLFEGFGLHLSNAPDNVQGHPFHAENNINDVGINSIVDYCDLMIAWGLFSGESRDAFRAALQIDDATWARGRGWALSQALIFIPYYLNTNPVGVGYARCAIDEALADYNASG